MTPILAVGLVVLILALFAGLWLGITTLLGWLSGWPALMARFPDQAETPLLRLTGQSGMVGPVRYNGALDLAACPSGLRIAVNRALAPFARAVLAPWSQIETEAGTTLFGKTVILRLGRPQLARLVVASHVADRLAAAAGRSWPQPSR